MISISVIIFVVFLNSFTSCDITLNTSPSPDKSCKTTLALCKLDVKKLNAVLQPSESGPTGPKGEVGDVGDDGLPGVNGLPGQDGLPGLKGMVGEPGKVPGVAVVKGPRGERGPKGAKGKRGYEGVQGKQGIKGARGDMGAAGMIGTSFSTTDGASVESDEAKKWGLLTHPATVTCRDAPESAREEDTETHYLYMGDMPVTCDFKTNMTCVLYDDELVSVPYNDTKPFWLSQKIAFRKIYSVEYDQISWLQQESYIANLTVRYHCLNSKPIGNDSMSLLLWNDLTVGPEPTKDTLFHYTVLNDGCQNATKDDWSTTDIMLVSPIAQRLPIIDFLIKDVGKENQALKIEILYLCFG